MKKLRVLAFLAALGLGVLGCGDAVESGSGAWGGSSGGEVPAGTSSADADKLIEVDEKGNTTNTIFLDPDTGKSVEKLSDIKSSATGDTPPNAPTFARKAGSESVPANLPVPAI
ncbi:hypothetical protein FACS189487_11220 [Campylobacterota bacterium]|nr:hypothetical protein FACS189487_11220 [Campylobacterota bacterium]